MGIITDIESLKNSDNCKLFIDDEFFIKAPLIIVGQERLKVGDSVDESDLENIINKSIEEKCWQYSINYLSKYNQTEKLFKDKLKLKEYTYETVDKTVAKLIEYGLLNDLQFAENFVLANKTRWGNKRLKYELMSRGINNDIIVDVLPSDEYETAYVVAEKWCENNYLESKKDEEKYYNFMLRKGFSFSLAKQVLKEVINDKENI